jgi:hypothetical protein
MIMKKYLLTQMLYQKFDPNIKRVNSDKSEKWTIISKKLFPNLVKKTGKLKNITFLQ